ncbi:MAG: SBBP repeat-containing protein [Crocinitomicaceae bacterium]|nr:SBBP repeat-containing protein [Flavobacteriales bacterium]NQZ37050.1 SBBP repeat-containing protein [Crocinitomicaceae bacterium]
MKKLNYFLTLGLFLSILSTKAQTYEWVQAFGGTSEEYAESITVDAVGNVYTTGPFQGTVDFDPGAGVSNLTSVGLWDVFIQKLDAAGNFLWAKAFGGTDTDHARSITVDTNGNVYTTGWFEGTVDFDPGAGVSSLTSVGYWDVFIQKLDPAGNFLWAKAFGGTSEEYAQSISIDANGNVYTTGYFWGTVDFDPGAGVTNLTSVGIWDIFVQKLDAAGNFLWAKAFGGTSSDIAQSISVDASGNVYTTGYFQGAADFDPNAGVTSLTSAGNYDIFVQKMDALGNFLWAKSFGGAASDYGLSISIDSSGKVYTTGSFEGTADLDPGAGITNHTSAGDLDIFVQKLDAAGNFLWAKAFGGTSTDGGRSINVDDNGYVYVTGNFQGTADFDPGAGVDNHTAAGSSDIFVHKISQCIPNNDTDIQIACDSYTWIDGNTYTSSNNTATHTLTNANGCDSVVTLDLTINTISDITTSLTGITITANNTSATAYQWLDCDNNFAVIIGENSLSFTATSNGNYAVELTENGCVDTATCIAITTVGIKENSFGDKLHIYPNPTSGNFSIDLGAVYEFSVVSITDISGKLIDSKTITQSQIMNLNINEPAGIYTISVQTAEKKAIIRVVKQ